nr:MAG TPA: hypothetical protein [Caudoviricetes sp.]
MNLRVYHGFSQYNIYIVIVCGTLSKSIKNKEILTI